MPQPPLSPSGQAVPPAAAPRTTAGRRLVAAMPSFGVGLVGLGAALVVLLHVIPPSNRVNLMTRTISEYALRGNGWVFDIAVLALVLGSVAVLAGLVRGGVVRALSGASTFLGLWSGGLVMLVLFEKYDFQNGVSTGASGMIHRMASLVAFLSLPTAALLTVRAARVVDRARQASWRRSAAWTRWAALASWACLSLLLYAIVQRFFTGIPWWRALPVGGLERLIALSDIVTLFALGSWARLALGSSTGPTSAEDAPAGSVPPRSADPMGSSALESPARP
jgi:Protein of unknown function (DUF998)